MQWVPSPREEPDILQGPCIWAGPHRRNKALLWKIGKAMVTLPDAFKREAQLYRVFQTSKQYWQSFRPLQSIADLHNSDVYPVVTVSFLSTAYRGLTPRRLNAKP